MYKEIIISVIIVILISVGDFLTQGYTERSIEEISNELQQLRGNLMEEKQIDQDKLQEKISTIYDNWEKMHQKLAYFIEHDELEKVETQLTSIKGNIEVAELEQSVPELDKCVFILKHIKNKEKLMIQNIF